MSNITVIDAIMGAGKTNYAIRYMSEAPDTERFIYITPFLSEVERIISNVKTRQFVQPTNANSEGRKLRSLKELIEDGRDIAATHSLFRSVDDEVIELLNGAGYTLILDEVMDVIEEVKIKRDDIRVLIESNTIEIQNNRVIWKDASYSADRFNDIKLCAEAENLYIFRESFVLWAFPSRIFPCFDKVFIMTYLFNAQIMSYYFKLSGFTYNMATITNGELSDYDVTKERRAELYALIDVYQGKMNDTNNKNAFSSTWLKRAKKNDKRIAEIKRNLSNYFRNILKAPSNAIMWATLKAVEPSVRGKGYSKSSLAVNARATNEYSDRWALAYVFNRFMSPHERSFFEENGIKVNEDLLAVSDLLQWIWRSRIRNGQPVHLYLPSSRMRSLLLAWSRYEI